MQDQRNFNIFFNSSKCLSHPNSTGACITKHSRLSVRSQLKYQLFLLLIFLSHLSLSSASPASYIREQSRETEARTTPLEPLGSTFLRLARSGTILVDRSPLPVPNGWLEHQGTAIDHIRRAESASSTPTRKSTSTVSPTSTSSGIIAAQETAVAALPTPFDLGFNNNITSKCETFMQFMLSNSTFSQCLPFSLLLGNSNSFFQTTKSLVRITQALDYSCAANVTNCMNVMSSFASNITTTCDSDLSNGNPLIQQALLGLRSYKTLYTASCLRNPTTSTYCFANAITNASNPTDSYIYFLPLNVSLVGGSQPTCDACLKNTMAVFAAASADRTQAVASTYVSAASQVNINCGPQFVNASLAEAAVSAASGIQPSTMGLGFLGVLIVWLL